MECLKSCNHLVNPSGCCKGECFIKCPNNCRVLLVHGDDPFPHLYSPPSPLPVPSDVIRSTPGYGNENNHHKHVISTTMIIVACLLGASLIVGVLCMVVKAYFNRQRNPRRTRSSPMVFNTQDDFFDEDQGPVIDHPIWYINTVGLPQSVIDSIAAFRYRKGEGLVDGIDCSVCLGEFQEDETLRLLPKCSHAFHLLCIDTWLRSHKTCPLCRAPIVSANVNVLVDVLAPTTGGLSLSEEPQMGNFDGSSSGGGGLIGNPEGEDGVGEVRIGVGSTGGSTLEDEANGGRLKLDLGHSILRDGCDLVENREDVGTEMQPMRRSVSLDSSSACVIYNAVSQVISGKGQWNCEAQQPKLSRVKRVDKRGSTGSLSFGKLMKSSSIGQSLQRGPVSMKKSFSSSGKSSLSSSSGETRSQRSALPL